MAKTTLINNEDRPRFLSFNLECYRLGTKQGEDPEIAVIELNCISLLVGATITLEEEDDVDNIEDALGIATLKIFDSIENSYQITKVIQV